MTRFQRRARWLTVLATGVRHAAAWCLLWGSTVLILRLLFDVPIHPLRLGILGLPLSWVVAWWTARHQRIDLRALRSLFDRQFHSGGLLMAAGERPLGPWSVPAPIPSSRVPRPRWRASRGLGKLALAGAFVVATFLVPTELDGVRAAQRLEIDQQLQTLEEQVRLLEEERLLEDDRGEALQETLETLRQEASGDDPAKAFETLDHVEQAARWAAEEGVKASLADGERLAVAEAVAEAIAAQSGLDPELTTDAMAEIAELLDGMNGANAWMSEELAAQLQGASEDPSALQEALANGSQAMRDSLEKLREAGLLNPETISRIEKTASRKSQQALEDFLQQNQMQASEGVCKMGNGRPGRGAVQRGPGHAPLTVRDAAEFDPALENRVLSPSEMNGVQETELLGQRWVAPQVDRSEASVDGGGLATSNADGGAAWTHTVLPRHRRAVREYFDPSVDEEASEDGGGGEPPP